MILAIALLFSTLSHSQTISGRCVGVTDGDTIKVLTPENVLHKVRLQGIDCPESKQPFGQRAKQAMSDLVFDRIVRLEQTGTDRYQRVLADVYVGETWVNLRMIQIGMAWAFLRYTNDARLIDAQATAKAAGIGLWSDRDPVPPWEWRKNKVSRN